MSQRFVSNKNKHLYIKRYKKRIITPRNNTEIKEKDLVVIPIKVDNSDKKRVMARSSKHKDMTNTAIPDSININDDASDKIKE